MRIGYYSRKKKGENKRKKKKSPKMYVWATQVAKKIKKIKNQKSKEAIVARILLSICWPHSFGCFVGPWLT
jgi:hypothetical protein